MTTRTADQIARSIANWNADDDTYSPIRNNVERDMIVAALSPPEPTEGLRVALETATARCQMFLDTFGDVGDCVTQADINDWHDALRAMPLQTPPEPNKRPVAFRVVRPASNPGFSLFHDEELAASEAELCGGQYQGLYVRDGRPLSLQNHATELTGGWQDISTAHPSREVWLFTPRRRLGPNEEDDIRFDAPRNWTWATKWMPANVPAPPMVAEERTK